MKKFLIYMQHNPFASSLAWESLEFALALSSFNQDVSLLFKGDGVLQILAETDQGQMVAKDFTKIYQGLHLFGIDKIYIEQNSMRAYATEDFVIQPQVIDDQQIAAIIKDHDVVMFK